MLGGNAIGLTTLKPRPSTCSGLKARVAEDTSFGLWTHPLRGLKTRFAGDILRWIHTLLNLLRNGVTEL